MIYLAAQGQMVKQILQYRLHVILLVPLLTLLPFPAITLQGAMVALAMGMVMAYVFLFNKTTDLLEDNINTAAFPINQKHKGILNIIAYACLIIPLLWLWRTPGILVVYLVYGGLLGFLYSYPVRIGKRIYRLKNILLVKNLTSAISLTACTCLPGYILYPYFSRAYFLLQAASIFLMVICVEIMCDIRDIDGDRRAGIRTLPNTVGAAGAKAVALFIFAGYCLWFYHQLPFRLVSPLLIIAQAATFLIILFTTEKRPYWYFHLPIFVGIAFCLANAVGRLRGI